MRTALAHHRLGFGQGRAERQHQTDRRVEARDRERRLGAPHAREAPRARLRRADVDLRVVLDGKILEPDSKALKWCGFVSGEVRIAHLIVSENASTRGETRKRASEANKDASATQPTCCSVM